MPIFPSDFVFYPSDENALRTVSVTSKAKGLLMPTYSAQHTVTREINLITDYRRIFQELRHTAALEVVCFIAAGSGFLHSV